MPLSQQRRLVAVSAMVTFGLGVFARVQRGEDQFDVNSARFYIGIGVAFTIVSIFTDLGLEIGAGFALLIMLAAIFTEGKDVLDFLGARSRQRNPQEKVSEIVQGLRQNRQDRQDRRHSG